MIVRIESPARLAEDADASDAYRDAMLALLGRGATSSLILHRGAYAVTARMDEGDEGPDVLRGTYIDLFDDGLAVVEDPALTPDSVGLWYDVDKIDKSAPAFLIALSGRAEKIAVSQRSLKFVSRSPSEMTVAARIRTKRPPKSVKIAARGGVKELPFDYEPDSETSYFTYPSDGEPVRVSVTF